MCVRPVIADDGFHRTYGERGAFLTADGERDGAQNHAILRGTKITSIRAFRVEPRRTYALAHVIAVDSRHYGYSNARETHQG